MNYCSHNTDTDVALLDMLTAPSPINIQKSTFARRDAALDPLLIAAAAASGPHITRNHYHHDFFPGVMLPQSECSWDWTRWSGDDAATKTDRKRLAYVSRQAPRRLRLQSGLAEEGKENDYPRGTDSLKLADNLPPLPKKRRPSLVSHANPPEARVRSKSISTPETPSPLDVKCMARTRIPTPHGPVFLHLYHNNRDNKEHLAIVVDPAQLDSVTPTATPIRSRSLDSVWSGNETEMDRIIRGAYVGRLSSTHQKASNPLSQTPSGIVQHRVPAPLIRIHSECFTGETMGSMRCDCGEQLDEAIRQISQPINIAASTSTPTMIPGRGAIIYLRQEGRGIGLLSKIRAYNLQDMGHDTVTANLMLGHKADERGYEIAGAILRDLGLGSDPASASEAEAVRILTNNPDKVEALRKESIRVVERVPMVPRSWQSRSMNAETISEQKISIGVERKEDSKLMDTAGVTLIGGKAVYGDDLDKYLRTKVLRMGHMLPLWLEDGTEELSAGT